jgi:diguanylate cyclase (GGDEF)-like protein
MATAVLIGREGENFYQEWKAKVKQVINAESRLPTEPESITDFHDRITKTLEVIAEELTRHGSDNSMLLHHTYLSAVKTIVVNQRRKMAVQLEIQKERFSDPEIRKSIDDTLKQYNSAVMSDWFAHCKLLRVPQLSDFLTIERAEELDNTHPKLADRIYDEKFHLLQSPSLLLPDMRFFRSKCEIRNVPLALAYIDIDDFKSFNTRHSNSVVDEYLLPRFMRAIESHLFYRGYGYRFGGDEYVFLLPNSDRDQTIRVLHEFQAIISKLDYEQIVGCPTVSIGFYVADASSYLTEREIEATACRAKEFAKNNGKDCVAYFKNDRLANEELTLVKRQESATN